jgi:hypothetical protein
VASGRTLVLGLAGDLGEQLDEVGQVVAEELGLKDQVLARVVRVEGRAQELGFTHDAQRRPPLGALQCHWPSVELCTQHSTSSDAYPECEVGEALGQAGQRLVAGARLCNQRERRRGACEVAAGELDALGLAGFILERARGGRCEAAALRRAEGLLAGGTLGAPAGGRAGEHGDVGAGRGAVEGGAEGNGWGACGRRWTDDACTQFWALT